MKKKWQILLFSLLLVSINLGYSQNLHIPRPSPKAIVGQTIGVCDVLIKYSRPSARNRQVLGKLVPYGKVWRVGANEATTIQFSHDLSINGNMVDAGKYALFIIANKNEWAIILNSDWDQWGAYHYDQNNDVLRVTSHPVKINHVEQFEINFTDVSKTSAVVNISWSDFSVNMHLETNTNKQTLDEIENVAREIQQYWYSYSAAAQYFFYELKDEEKAIHYIDKAIALEAPNPAPWMLKSQIKASQGEFKDAIHLAEQALEVSRKHNFYFEIEENEEKIKAWKTKI